MAYAYIWEYIVKVDQMENFINAYGADGDWVQLFSDVPGYVETRLYRDSDQINRFLTTDYWESKNAFEDFKESNADVYLEIDERYSLFSILEKFVGEFEVIGPEE